MARSEVKASVKAAVRESVKESVKETVRAAIKAAADAGAEIPGIEKNTRERILDVALELFIEKGFDQASLREIAEQLGITKAALYYHFASKDDILMALHLRLHEITNEAVSALEGLRSNPGAWESSFAGLIGGLASNRRIFLMHERNRLAFERLHMVDHEADHRDIEDQIRTMMADDSVPIEARFRLICAFGAMTFGMLFSGEMTASMGDNDLEAMMRSVLHDLFLPFS